MGESGIAQANRLVGQYRGATLALRQNKGMEEVHAYRIAARRLLALLALWRPLIHEPELERRLTRAAGTLSALRDAQVNVRVINQGAWEINLIVGVSSSDYEKALQAIYNAFVS